MKFSKVLALVLAVAMCLFVFVGCQPTTPTESTAPASTEPAESTAPESTEPAVELIDYDLLPGKPYDGTVLKHLGCCDTAKQWVQMIAALETTFYPLTGIQASWEAVPWDNYQAKLLTEAVSGTGTYDTLAWQDAWGTALRNYLEPLDPYIDRDGLDRSDYPTAFLETGKCGTDTVYGLCIRGHFQALFYRTDVFADLGIEVPETWDQLVAAGQKIVAETDMWGIAQNFGVTGGAQNLMSFWPILWSNGGDVFDADYNVILNNAEGIEAVHAYLDTMLVQGIASPDCLTYGESESKVAMGTGNAAMFIGLSWLFGTFTDPETADPAVIGNVGVARIPGFEGKEQWSYTNLFPSGLFANGKQKDAAWEFTKFQTSAQFDKENYLTGTSDYVVYHNSTFQDEEINATTGGMQKFGFEILQTARILPAIQEWPQVVSIIEVAMNDCAGGADIQTTFDKAASDITTIMTEAGYYD